MKRKKKSEDKFYGIIQTENKLNIITKKWNRCQMYIKGQKVYYKSFKTYADVLNWFKESCFKYNKIVNDF